MPTFSKNERLRSQAVISSLFKNGKSFAEYPFVVVWQRAKVETKSPAQILISIPRKNIRQAVMRNLLKRRIREIYRKNKEGFYSKLMGSDTSCIFALIYTEKRALRSIELEPKINVILQRLIQYNAQDFG